MSRQTLIFFLTLAIQSTELEAFRRESRTRKAIHLVMISPYGVLRNMYSGAVTNQVTLDALFE